MKTALGRKRRAVNPSLPETLEELADEIYEHNDRYGILDSKEQVYLGRRGEGDSAIIIYGNAELIRKHAKDVEEIHLDGTFKTRPKKPTCGQIFSILAIIFGVAFPMFMVLMKTRQIPCYDQLFEFISMSYPELQPKVAISDYETAIHTSFKKHFASVKLVGCFFHFAQAIYRKARSLRLDVEDEIIWKVVRMLIATALVPPPRIPEAFDRIKTYAKDNFKDKDLDGLFTYFDTYWMKKVKPECFSVYGQANRTNNFQEGFHRAFKDLVNEIPASVWKVLDAIITRFRVDVSSLTRFETGEAVPPEPRKKWIAQDRNIRKATMRLTAVNPTYNMIQFLSAMAHRVSKKQTPLVDEEVPELEDVEIGPLDVNDAAALYIMENEDLLGSDVDEPGSDDENDVEHTDSEDELPISELRERLRRVPAIEQEPHASVTQEQPQTADAIPVAEVDNATSDSMVDSDDLTIAQLIRISVRTGASTSVLEQPPPSLVEEQLRPTSVIEQQLSTPDLEQQLSTPIAEQSLPTSVIEQQLSTLVAVQQLSTPDPEQQLSTPVAEQSLPTSVIGQPLPTPVAEQPIPTSVMAQPLSTPVAEQQLPTQVAEQHPQSVHILEPQNNDVTSANERAGSSQSSSTSSLRRVRFFDASDDAGEEDANSQGSSRPPSRRRRMHISNSSARTTHGFGIIRNVASANSRTSALVQRARNSSHSRRQPRGRGRGSNAFITHSNESLTENEILEAGTQALYEHVRDRYFPPDTDSSDEDTTEVWRTRVVVDPKLKFTKAQAKWQKKVLGLSLDFARRGECPKEAKYCYGCTSDQFLYEAAPCKHEIYCEECVMRAIQLIPYTYSTQYGNEVYFGRYVPIKCPVCSAVIGEFGRRQST